MKTRTALLLIQVQAKVEERVNEEVDEWLGAPISVDGPQCSSQDAKQRAQDDCDNFMGGSCAR